MTITTMLCIQDDDDDAAAAAARSSASVSRTKRVVTKTPARTALVDTRKIWGATMVGASNSANIMPIM